MSKFISFLNQDLVYYIVSGVLAILVLVGIFLMSKVKRAKIGNIVSAVAILLATIITVFKFELIPVANNTWLLVVVYSALLIGTAIGLLIAFKIKMIEMPQLIGLLNGLGGLASLIVGTYVIITKGDPALSQFNLIFNDLTAIIAIIVGGFTFTGSLVAAGKLHRVLPQKPIKFQNHYLWTLIVVALMAIGGIAYFFIDNKVFSLSLIIIIILLSFFFGFLFTATIGGADMPIAISLLNSLSGVAGAVSGLAINDVLLVSVGAIVGASGLLLTQIMCKSMNRKLIDILLGKTTTQGAIKKETVNEEDDGIREEVDFRQIAKDAKSVIIVPGYGMAVAQAQHILKKTADEFKKNGATVRYAIHPVAGRMPGHMNVLLVEANVDYEDLYEMDQVNADFKETDLVLVVGANDVVNPAAKTEVDTPIYNMPILDVEDARHVFIFNYDLQPGYAGVDNPLYKKKKGVTLFLGNALDTLEEFLNNIK